MSWDNVSDIENIKIWTDYSDSTQGHLFVNDNHQLKLYVGISFKLEPNTTEGPTEDEVKSALSLINNQDSGPLKYLTTSTPEGKFTAIYDPAYPASKSGGDMDNIDDGIYDFIFTYWAFSPTTMNAEAHSEAVALKLQYTVNNSDGTTTEVVKTTSATGNYYVKTCVSIVCYPAKLYGMYEENRTAINYGSTTVAEADHSNISGHFSHSHDSFKVYWFYIDDPYFKIFTYDGCTEPDDTIELNPYYIYREYSKPQYDHIYNAFFPNVKCGEMDYGVKIVVRSDLDDSHNTLVTEHITVHQKENQITFLTGYTVVQNLNNATDKDDRIYLRVYDQFGNSSYVVAFSNADDAFPLSVS